MTGGVATETVDPLLTDGAVVLRRGYSGDLTVRCTELTRVLSVTCPLTPGTGFVEQVGESTAYIDLVLVPTDGSLAAENRVRTRAASLVPNAIINSDRDPIDYNLETFFQDTDRLGAVAALFVLLVGAFGLAASMIGGVLERRRPFALLRASGVHLSELRRTVLLETATTMAVVSVAGVGVGMLLAYASTLQSDVSWRWPGPETYGLIGGAFLAALLFSALALPLLNLTTRHDAVRFE